MLIASRIRSLALVVFMLPCATLASAQAHILVSVGDHRLDVVREGSGSPAVVFETGLADSLDTWLPMLHATAEETLAIAYSRAGFGRSDRAKGPDANSARQEVDDLHALLHRLVQPPYVLVARSYGSILVRLYTSLYPADVAGLVLVDGTHEQQVKRYGTIDSLYPHAFKVFYDSVLATKQNGPEAAEIRETVRIQEAGTVEGLTPLPDVPIAVLTSMKADSTSIYVNGTARGHVVWRELHDEWFRRSTNGIHIQTSRSGHGIQVEQPTLVLSAIRYVLDQIRTH